MTDNSESGSELDAEELRQDLEDCLVSLSTAGDFAVFDSLPKIVNPGLSVKGVGKIGLPLSDRDAKAIVDASREASLKDGDAANMESGTKPWKLSPDYFEVRNPVWPNVIKSILEKVIPGLGMESQVRKITGELNTMLLCETGVSLQLAEHTSDIASMLGNLIICLPSFHEGGEIRLSYSGQVRTFDTAKHSEFDSSFIAWYSSVHHDIKPVDSGYRLLLSYNLRYSGSSCGSPSAAIEESTNLYGLISRWTKSRSSGQRGSSQSLIYNLEHKHSNANLCYDTLNDHDKQVVKHLQNVCAVNEGYLYLAKMVRTVSGRGEQVEGQNDHYEAYNRRTTEQYEFHDVEYEESDSVELIQVVDCSGRTIAGGIRTNKYNIIQGYPIDRVPDDEDFFADYHGGTTVTHYYRDTVVIVIPKRSRASFFIGHHGKSKLDCNMIGMDMSNWLRNLSTALDNDPSSAEAISELVQACRMVISSCVKKSRYTPYSSEIVERAISAAIRINQKSLFISALAFDWASSPASCLQVIGRGITIFGMKSTRAAADAGIGKVHKFSERMAILHHISKEFEPLEGLLTDDAVIKKLEQTEFSNWVKGLQRSALMHCHLCSNDDGSALAKLARRYDPKFLFDQVLPAAKAHASSNTMVLSFMNNLLKIGQQSYDQNWNNITLKIFQEMWPYIVHSFSLYDGAVERRKRQKITNGSLIPTQPVLDLTNLAPVICGCFTSGMISEASQMIEKLIEEARKVPVLHFEKQLLPFLKLVLDELLRQKGDISHKLVHNLMYNILFNYIENFVQHEPTRSVGWTRPARGCGCADCQILDKFLKNPDLEQFRFAKTTRTRQHLEDRLKEDRTDFDFHTTMLNGFTQTLTITKVKYSILYFREHPLWERRCDRALKQIWSLGNEDTLKTILAEDFDMIMKMDWIRHVPPSSERSIGATKVKVQAKDAVCPKSEDIEVIVID